MVKKFLLTTAVAAMFLTVSSVEAAITVNPLTGFGGSDGWLAPGEGGYTFLGTGNLERGLAYGNDHLYLVSRNGGSFIRRLDPLTGGDLGSPLSTSGISGGTYLVNMVSVGGDGAIYVGNLTTQASSSPYKVYRWATEGAAATVAYSGTPILGGRVGDTLDAIGSGSSTLLVAGFNQTPNTNGNNGYATINVVNPTGNSHTQVTFTGTPPNAGDFTLGITFSDSSHVLGTRGSQTLRVTSFTGSTGTLLGTGTLTTGSQRPLDYTVLGGIPLLAAMDTVDSKVRLYDATDPLNLVYINTVTTQGTVNANVNGTGSMAWGDSFFDSVSGHWKGHLYAMNSNNGIQAFIVEVPEPATASLAALGGLLFAVWTARRRLS